MKRLVLLLALFILPGCAQTGWLGPQLNPADLHAAVFTEGYRRIGMFYLEPKATGDIAIAEFAGLSEGDPALSAEIEGKQFHLKYREREIASMRVPASDDYSAWGDLTFKMVGHAREASYKLGKLKVDETYTVMFTAAMKPLDPYSHYLPPEDVKTEGEWRTGYGGIGVTFERRGERFAVLDVFVGSPAEGAGLKAGDAITAIDGAPTAALSTKEFAAKVRGPIGSEVHLTAEKAGNLTIKRAQVVPTTVALNMSGPMAVIRISRFLPGTVAEFRKAARAAVWQGAKGVVLDLQHNPGGYLDSATEIANLLVPRGLVLRTAGRNPGSAEEYNAGGADILVGLPLVILQDGRSASAAEVLSAAITERGRGIAIGSTSFGKGSVQNVAPLPNGGEMAITWARMYGPDGKTFHQVGLAPQVCLAAAEGPCPKADSVEALALPKALALLQDVAQYEALKR